MKEHNKKHYGSTPDNLKRLGSMNAFLMPDPGSFNDSGFSLELTEDEFNEMLEFFVGLEDFDEEDN